MRTLEGQLQSSGKRYALIVSRFNELINSKLLSGAIDCLKRHGALESEYDVIWVPGAFEIPLIADRLCQQDYDAVIALGAVIRGATPHFNYISAEVSKGVAQISLKYGKPVIFGVLTTDTIEQAIERAGMKSGNKGWDAALSAIEMVNLLKEIEV
ncbi:MAG: 6,7-dimethyl-8-ribityllumazine synthase [Candidatus Cloacimonetes bacterium]|nr:6,7-dimethyl-8-ribityllumazine synthase [Candidatus Cloacimonadota bacterium]